MNPDKFEIAVIGAGAAGLATAIHLARNGHPVCLLDAKEKIGAKILMSGGTRCNLTNQKVIESDFATSSSRVLRSILERYPSEKAIRFFEELGLRLVFEEGGKCYPHTHSGKTVLEALLKEIRRLPVALETGKKVMAAKYENNRFELQTSDGSRYSARFVILAAGGLSYPATGSDGTGYEIAKAFGHQLIETTPSLVPLTSPDKDWAELSGLSVEVILSLWAGGKKTESFKGSMLFTHFGFSGPVILDISRYFLREKRDKKMAANFLPGLKEEALRALIQNETQTNPAKKIPALFAKHLPSRFVELFLRKLDLSANTPLNQLTKDSREKLIRELYHYVLPVNGDLGYAKAEVTAGGIDLKEVDQGTLESKKVPGLYFVGEILDVDGRIGGFNFQWAWSSAYAAAEGICKKLAIDP